MSNFNWKEYAEKANSFAVFKDQNYLALAIIEEIGELTGKFAKALRGDAPLDKAAAALELGDILWVIAVSAYRYDDYTNFEEIEATDVQAVIQGAEDLEDWMIVVSLLDFVFNCEYAKFNAYLHLIAHRLGTTLEECAVQNLAKLEDRLERGVIQGEGDER